MYYQYCIVIYTVTFDNIMFFTVLNKQIKKLTQQTKTYTHRKKDPKTFEF